MRVIPSVSLLVACLATWPLLVTAGDCRPQLRPLLLKPDPAPADVLRVRTLCETEARAGDADATYQLALFSLGLGGTWQPGEAVPLIRDAADRGVSEAQYWLAWQSEAGPALPHDPATALAWYEKAAAGRHRLALQRLAEASERGELGLAVDRHKALAYRAQIRRCDEENARASR
ncbi:MAG: hypothetical protein ABIX37_12360 [Gammaproteobacteria bacterium]